MTHPYGVLFESVQIGPVTAPNRFYQVPHCNGMGYRHPARLAAMRGVKAEGGWGVVSTEEVEIHPSSDLAPAIEGHMWDDNDIHYHSLTTEAVHSFGALAAIELVHNGPHSPNLDTRLPPIAPSARPVDSYHPVHARAMDLSDIKNIRTWHVDAAKRSKIAGYDIVYAYAGHSMSLLMHFLQSRNNHRTDDYGGSVRNRIRLIEEVITDMKDAVGDRCAVALRLAVDELRGPEGLTFDGETQEIIGRLADLPDLWDVNVSGWENDSVTARFEPNEGYQDKYTSFVKSLTTKPVVGVGRFTSVDAMISRIKAGKLDFIGAARPSIADPFLPNKIRGNRIDEIRECIGCNICVSGDMLSVPIRCTQNPTMGEEWRRGWRPEHIRAKTDNGKVLVVGGGPAGMECALQFSNRGYDVAIAEAGNELGGRLNMESQLPGLSSYIRVRDYREYYLKRRANIELYFDSHLSAEDILQFGFDHVYLATGAYWRADGTGRHIEVPLETLPDNVLTPDDIASGAEISGNVIIYDDDHYYMGSVLAEKFVTEGYNTTLITPAVAPATWTQNTLEFNRVQRRLLESGVTICANHVLTGGLASQIDIKCVYTGRRNTMSCDTLVLVTAKNSNNKLYNAIQDKSNLVGDIQVKTIQSIGDCLVPGTVANAIYLGHLAARNHGGESWETEAFKREFASLKFKTKSQSDC